MPAKLHSGCSRVGRKWEQQLMLSFSLYAIYVLGGPRLACLLHPSEPHRLRAWEILPYFPVAPTMCSIASPTD